MERVKRNTYFDYWTWVGLSSKWSKKNPNQTWTEIQTLAVTFCGHLSVGPMGWGCYRVTGRDSSCTSKQPWDWHGCGWCLCRPGWALVVRGEAAGGWLAVTGRMWAVTIPSAWVRYGLCLPSDCLASSGGEPRQRRAGWLSRGTHLQLWQWPSCEGFLCTEICSLFDNLHF